MTEYFKKMKDLEGKKVSFDEFYKIFPTSYTKDPQTFKSRLVEQSKFLEKSGIECKKCSHQVIPGTKAILKQLLGADYNNPAVEPIPEPKKPASLNLFLQWRKEFSDAPVYKNLPPQEGFHEDDAPTQAETELQEQVKKFADENIDFQLLDLDKDIEKSKRPVSDPDAELDKEEQVYERAEQVMSERLGDPLSDKLNDAQTDKGLFKNDFSRDHEGARKSKLEREAVDELTGKIISHKAELFDDKAEDSVHPVIDRFLSETNMAEGDGVELKRRLFQMTEAMNEAPQEEDVGTVKEKKCKTI